MSHYIISNIQLQTSFSLLNHSSQTVGFFNPNVSTLVNVKTKQNKYANQCWQSVQSSYEFYSTRKCELDSTRKCELDSTRKCKLYSTRKCKSNIQRKQM